MENGDFPFQLQGRYPAREEGEGRRRQPGIPAEFRVAAPLAQKIRSNTGGFAYWCDESGSPIRVSIGWGHIHTHPQYTRTSCGRGLASSLSSNTSPQPSHNREPRPSLAAWAQPPSPPKFQAGRPPPSPDIGSQAPHLFSCHGCSCLFAAVFSPWLDILHHHFRQWVANTMKRLRSFSFASGPTGMPRTLFSLFVCLFLFPLSSDLPVIQHSSLLFFLNVMGLFG